MIMQSSKSSAIPMDKQTFIDLINKSMQDSVRQVQLHSGYPVTHATREDANRQVKMLNAGKEAYKQTEK